VSAPPSPTFNPASPVAVQGVGTNPTLQSVPRPVQTAPPIHPGLLNPVAQQYQTTPVHPGVQETFNPFGSRPSTPDTGHIVNPAGPDACVPLERIDLGGAVPPTLSNPEAPSPQPWSNVLGSDGTFMTGATPAADLAVDLGGWGAAAEEVREEEL
jgi:hypothetical protein